MRRYSALIFRQKQKKAHHNVMDFLEAKQSNI